MEFPAFADFTEPERSDEDRFVPKDNVGHVVVVKPLEHKTGVITDNSPLGTDAIGAQVLDLDAPAGVAVYRDALIFGGAFVDAFRPFIGQTVVVKIASRKSKSGRNYTVPVAVEDADKKRAEAEFAKGDPFAPELTTVASQTEAEPPF